MNLLFLCTGNSCRSQMAEGWARHLLPYTVNVYSAGVEAHGVNPLAAAVMLEAGVDISEQTSKLVTDITDVQWDVVVTVCDSARERCPVLPGHHKKFHHSFDDPPALAKGLSQDAAMEVYRRVRDEIRDYVLELESTIR